MDEESKWRGILKHSLAALSEWLKAELLPLTAREKHCCTLMLGDEPRARTNFAKRRRS
jgi:hypothetical protein